MEQFNPIQSKWVVEMQMRSVGLLQQSIPFLVAVLYIMVQIFKFSFIICSLKVMKTSSLHKYFNEQNTNQATSCLDFQYSIFFFQGRLDTLFQLQSIPTLIVQTTVSQL